jgi:hypothetical protein
VFSTTGAGLSIAGVSISPGKLLHADKVNEINKMLMLVWLLNRTHYSLVWLLFQGGEVDYPQKMENV